MPNVVWFLIAFAALLVGYFIYGRIIEKLFGPDLSRPTPAVSMNDGVDYVKLPTWKIFLIQLLNIAGVGPVFGPIMGALYGPAALLWIVLGTLFAGAVHDYFSGMMSLRYNGKSVADVIGFTLGNGFKQFMRAFSLVLLVLVGTVFVSAPAGILAIITPSWGTMTFWMIIIFIYYFLATIMPIDVIIARLYPIFAIVLLIMAFGVAGGLIIKGYNIYGWTRPEGVSVFANVHPKGLPLWPLMFITIACGALSGFHATQSPLMARCIASEKNGRMVFYGAMVAEGAIGLVWATAGLSFYESPEALQAALANPGGAAYVVREVSLTLLGTVGGVLAILGVVVLPISSGDTAFRAARLLVSDFTGINQNKATSRLMIAVPLFVIGIFLCQIDFSIIWRYFGWSNQSLATVCLWAGAAYLVRKGSLHWLVTIPAVFMTATCVAYIMGAPEGFKLPWNVSYGIGIGAAVVALAWFLVSIGKFKTKILLELPVPSKVEAVSIGK
ncbi:MAG: carbon starvation protein A [Deltaproteobacteria bacterium]|jgi:carbon starvation protein CstA|nr:carbon starvation protein A [Deltaproteobacteria bacterium]